MTKETDFIKDAAKFAEPICEIKPETIMPFPSPTDEMVDNDPLFEVIWQVIKGWDIAVPHAYYGYCSATGNHVKAILDAVNHHLDKQPQSLYLSGDQGVEDLMQEIVDKVMNGLNSRIFDVPFDEETKKPLTLWESFMDWLDKHGIYS